MRKKYKILCICVYIILTIFTSSCAVYNYKKLKKLINKINKNTMDITIKNVELSYSSLFEAKDSLIKNKKLFTALLLIPKSDTAAVENLKASILALAEDQKFKTYSSPLKDGDSIKNARGEDIDPPFPGYFYLNVSSGEAYPPALYRVVENHNKKTLKTIDRFDLDAADKESFLRGATVAVKIKLKPYEMAHKGITAYLSEIAQISPGKGNFKEFLKDILGCEDYSSPIEKSILEDI